MHWGISGCESCSRSYGVDFGSDGCRLESYRVYQSGVLQRYQHLSVAVVGFLVSLFVNSISAGALGTTEGTRLLELFLVHTRAQTQSDLGRIAGVKRRMSEIF